MMAVHTPGADQRRAWQSEDRSYLVLTIDRGRIVALRNFRAPKPWKAGWLRCSRRGLISR